MFIEVEQNIGSLWQEDCVMLFWPLSGSRTPSPEQPRTSVLATDPFLGVCSIPVAPQLSNASTASFPDENREILAVLVAEQNVN